MTTWDLRSLDQLALILTKYNGVIYTNQTGGYACNQREALGALVLLEHGKFVENEWRDPHDKVAQYFTSPKWGGWCDNGIDDETADHLDAAFQWAGMGRIKVDRAKLSESEEAWVHVTVDGDPAILTWGNSD